MGSLHCFFLFSLFKSLYTTTTTTTKINDFSININRQKNENMSKKKQQQTEPDQYYLIFFFVAQYLTFPKLRNQAAYINIKELNEKTTQ